MSEPALRFETEWLTADGVTSPELAATWCRLSIRIGDRTVTRVEDLTANSTRGSIFCSAYPLAEWIATHWWALRSHVRPAALLDGGAVSSKVAGPDRYALAAHDVRAAGDGFRWPRLLIVPEGSRTLLTWSADDVSQGAGVLRFVSAGRTWASPPDVQQALAGLVTTVIDRLGEMSVSGTLLEEEWGAITNADGEEVEFCNAAAALGLDPYDIDEQMAERIQSIGSILEPELLDEFAVAVDPSRISEDASWVVQGLERLARASGPPAAALARLRHVEVGHSNGGQPWEIGWRHAQDVRSVLGVRATDPINLDGLIGHQYLTSADTALQALASGSSGRIQVVFGSRPGVSARRFVEGRALWRSLRVPDRAYLLTTAPTFEQRVERAFAAELLAPASGIAEMLDVSPGVVVGDQIERLARHFKTSPVVVSHQLENQLGLIPEGGRV